MYKTSRRKFLKDSSIVSLAARSGLVHAKNTQAGNLLLVGTQTIGTSTSKGIYAYTFDPVSGELKQIGLAAASENPTFLALAPDRKTVFAANELDKFEGQKSGAVSSFLLDHANAKLTEVNQVAAHGDGTCMVSVDHTGHCVFAANYGGGSAASFAVDKGGHLSQSVSFFQYTGHGPTKQQSTAHAHRVTVSPDNRFLLVNDLGLDKIHIYRLDAATARLTPNTPSEWKAAPGSGPRALQFHPNGKWVYCANEISSTVNVLHWDAQRGALETVQDLALLPPAYHGPAAASEIVLDQAGHFAYAAVRFGDFVAWLKISQKDGTLSLLDRSSCGGKVPRHIALDPSDRWLLSANEETNNIAVFARNQLTGHLAHTGKSFPQAKPQCLVFA